MDLSKPLKALIEIGDGVHHFEYEGLNLICYSCGKYGHAKENCVMNKVQTEEPHETRNASMNGDVDVLEKATLDYRPWMQVTFARWKKSQSNSKKQMDNILKSTNIGVKNKEISTTGSRFSALSEEVEPLGPQDQVEASQVEKLMGLNLAFLCHYHESQNRTGKLSGIFPTTSKRTQCRKKKKKVQQTLEPFRRPNLFKVLCPFQIL